MNFENRVIMIIGASGGIGRATAVLLSHRDARVILVGRSDAKLMETKQMCLTEDVHAFVQLVIRDGNSDVICDGHDPFIEGELISGVVFCVGEELMQPAYGVGGKVMDQFNLGPLLFLDTVGRLVVKQRLAPGASIVAVSSVASQRGVPMMSAYSAAKAAVEGAVRSLAVELAPKNVRVNAIAVGAVDTPMHERVLRRLPQAAQDAYAAKHPLGIGKPEDVANAAAFLLSKEARWITGTTMVVDGGYLARG